MKAALLATLAAVVVACKGGLTSSSELTAGVYHLLAINGQALPYLLDFTDADNKFELESGQVSIGADGNFVDATTFLATQSGVASEETEVASGQWTQKGSTITFTPSDGSDPYVMTLNGDTRLIQNVGNLSFAYVR